MRRLWQKALTVFFVVCIGLTPVAEPLSRAYPADASVMGEPAGIEAGQEPVSKVGPDSEERSMPPNVVSDEAGTPQRQPPPVPVPTPEVQPQATKVYTPSAIPIEDLKPDHPWTYLNVALPVQDPDEVGARIAASLRVLSERDERGPVVAYTPPASAEITALAEGLDNDPGLIYEYVHNNVDFAPTWGLFQSPGDTYLSKVGNAFDQATLLLALLEAAGYQAEYAFGTVEIPLSQAMNWVGVTNEQVLPHVFSLGGIPAKVEGDVVRMDHVWVRVNVDGTWYPLDPSFKTYRTSSGIDLISPLGYDRETFLSGAESGAWITSDYVRDINQENIQSSLTQYANNLIAYLRDNAPFAYLEEILGGREIVPETVTQLPTQLPYVVVEHLGESPEMPDSYVYKWHFELPGIDYTAYFPDIVGERVTVFYYGATQQDRDRIEQAGGIYNVYPAYNVNMKPHLAIGGEVVATGDALPLGTDEPVLVTVVSPVLDSEGNPYAFRYQYTYLRAGAWYAFPMSAPCVSPDALRRQHRILVDNRAAGYDDSSEQVLGQSLHLIGLSWFNQVEASNRVDSLVAQVVPVILIRAIVMSQDLRQEWQQVGGQWKVVRVHMASYTLDVALSFGGAVSATGDADRERAFMIHTNLKASAAEGAVLEQLQDTPAVSTARILHLANAQGLKIYHVTTTNLDWVLRLLDYPDVFKQTLRSAVEAGNEVFVPEGPISVGQWFGTGWIALHPESGNTGAYITGGIGWGAGQSLSLSDWARAHSGGSVTEEDILDILLIEAILWILALGPWLDLICDNPNPEKNPNIPPKTDPVDTATGSFLYSRTDVAFGVRGFPISFPRAYVSSRHTKDGPLGFGWIHSYDMSLVESSDWARGFGFRTAMDAASAIAEAYVGVDIAATPAGELPHQRMVIGTENADWILSQMTGNVVTVTGPEGTQYEYLRLSDGTYQPPHRTYSTLMENADGTYTVKGRDGSQINFNAEGKATGIEDAECNRTAFTYDAEGNLIRVTDAVGRSIELSYADGRLTQISDPANRTFRYEYDADGNLISYTDPRGGVTRHTYDEQHRLVSITDPENITYVTNTYDDLGRVVEQVDGRGGVTRLHYGDVRTKVTDPMGYETVYFYDTYRRLVGVRDALGYTRTAVYDANSNLLAYQDKAGNLSLFEYDERGNVVRMTDPMGNSATFEFDGVDNLVRMTNPLGQTTRFAYDSRHNLIRLTDALGHDTQYSYDQRGQLVTITDPTGATTQMSYNEQGNLIAQTDGLGHATTFTYDEISRPLTFTDAQGHTTQLAYDAGDNVLAVTDPVGYRITYVYDAVGNPIRIIDAAGNATQYSYDPHFNLATVTDAAGNVTRYTYDANDHLICITNACGHEVSFERDALGRVTTVRDALGRASQFAYDPKGNLLERVKADNKRNTYSYDANDRLIEVAYSDGSKAQYRYDAVGNLIEASYRNWQAWYTYDALNQVTQITFPGLGWHIDYTYDGAGYRSDMIIAKDDQTVSQVSYERDSAGRLTGLEDVVSADRVEYTYDRTDNLVGIRYSNGTNTTYDYTANGWLRRVESRKGPDVLAAFEYSYDAAGNPVQVAETTPYRTITYTYQYDQLNRLTAAINPRYTVTYGYDDVGNMIHVTGPLGTTNYIYDAADQLVQAGPTTFEYDANGNLTAWTDARGRYLLRYDDEDRLVEMTVPGGDTYGFSYDTQGHQVSSRSPDQFMRFLYDGWEIVVEEEASRGEGAVYVYGNKLLALRRSFGGGAVVGTPEFYHGDSLGSVRVLTGADGRPLTAYSYDSFGYPGRVAGVDAAAPRFVGQQGVRAAQEGAPGLYLMGRRFYHPGIGRFLSRDPLGGDITVPAAWNPYAYAYNNPLLYTDPLGLRPNRAELRRDYVCHDYTLDCISGEEHDLDGVAVNQLLDYMGEEHYTVVGHGQRGEQQHAELKPDDVVIFGVGPGIKAHSGVVDENGQIRNYTASRDKRGGEPLDDLLNYHKEQEISSEEGLFPDILRTLNLGGTKRRTLYPWSHYTVYRRPGR